MKLKKDLVLRQVADTWIILTVGEAVTDFNCMMTLNEVGANIWKYLKDGHEKEEIAQRLCEQYDAPYAQVLADVEEFIAKLVKAGCAE